MQINTEFQQELEESGYIAKLDSYVYQSVYGFLEKR